MILNSSWLKLSSQATRSHSCRSSTDLFAEALALSCFYKSAYLLFDMIGFEKCLWTVKSWKQYTIQRQQLKRQQANSKASLQISAEFTYFSNFEKRTFVNEKFAPQKKKLWQFVQFVRGSFCVCCCCKGRPDICHEYHELYSWRKNCHVEKFQLSMYDNCGEISVQLMGFYCNLCRFVAKSVIHAVLSRNFCHNIRAFVWRKIEPKSTFVENKMTNIRSGGTIVNDY